MSLHLRSTLRRALQLANQTANGQKAALGQLAPSQKFQPSPNFSKFENNIVTSPYGDCQLHDMTMVQKVFESASRWPNKIATVRLPCKLKLEFCFNVFFLIFKRNVESLGANTLMK